ncbi:MAG: hypothetical protein ACE14V_02125 [bacterium]
MLIQHFMLLGITGISAIGLVFWVKAVYLYFKTQSYTQVSKIERYLTLVLIGYVILVLGLVLVSHNSNLAWVYRNPILSILWRFAVAYLIAIPIIHAVKENQFLDTKLYLTAGIILILIILPPLTGIIMYYAINSFLGYFEVMLYNPWQVLIPISAAIIGQLWLIRKEAIPRRLIHRILLFLGISIWILFVLVPISTSTLFIPPDIMNYRWFQPYISQKYGVKAQSDIFEDAPQPIYIVNDQPTPAGLKLKYLFYGEKAIDCFSMID